MSDLDGYDARHEGYAATFETSSVTSVSSSAAIEIPQPIELVESHDKSHDKSHDEHNGIESTDDDDLLIQFERERIATFIKFPSADFFSQNPTLNVNLVDPRGNSLLHQVCLVGRRECLDVLMAQPSIHLQARNADKETPLHLAVKGGKADYRFVRQLAEKVKDLNARDERGRTPSGWRAKSGMWSAVWL